MLLFRWPNEAVWSTKANAFFNKLCLHQKSFQALFNWLKPAFVKLVVQSYRRSRRLRVCSTPHSYFSLSRIFIAPSVSYKVWIKWFCQNGFMLLRSDILEVGNQNGKAWTILKVKDFFVCNFFGVFTLFDLFSPFHTKQSSMPYHAWDDQC